jgi:hypothetical protein
MRIKAKQAMDKAEAEKFIHKKQMRKQTAILSAAKWAMQQKGGLGGGGTGGGAANAWKMASNVALSVNSSSTAIPSLSPSDLNWT